MKARQRPAVEGYRLRQELEGDNLFEFQVFSLIDFAHAASTNQTDDAIALGHIVPVEYAVKEWREVHAIPTRSGQPAE